MLCHGMHIRQRGADHIQAQFGSSFGTDHIVDAYTVLANHLQLLARGEDLLIKEGNSGEYRIAIPDQIDQGFLLLIRSKYQFTAVFTEQIQAAFRNGIRN